MKVILALLLALASLPAFASGTANAVGHSSSDSGAMAATGPITFEGSQQRGTTTAYVTPPIYTAPSAFSLSPYNCGGADTLTVGTPWVGGGTSHAKTMPDCSGQANALLAMKMGMMQVAILRAWCFGTDANRMSYEAAGHICPASATAKGIPGAPVGPKFAVAKTVEPTVRHGTINADGTTTWKD